MSTRLEDMYQKIVIIFNNNAPKEFKNITTEINNNRLKMIQTLQAAIESPNDISGMQVVELMDEIFSDYSDLDEGYMLETSEPGPENYDKGRRKTFPNLLQQLEVIKPLDDVLELIKIG
jgi:hypothetical protein